MNNVLILLKVQFLSLLKANSQGSKKRKAAGLGTLFILGAAFLYMAVVYAISMVATFPEGYKHIALYVMGILTIIMLMIFGYQSAGGHLFGFKDFDLLMSLPVRKEEVLISKFVSFLMLEYFYAFFILVPSIIIVGISCSYGISYYLLGFITLLLAPIVPMVLSSILAYGSMKLASKFKYKNLMNNIFYVILMGLVFGLVFGSQELLYGNITQLVSVMENVQKYLPFIALMFDGMTLNNYVHFLLGCLINIVVFILFVVVFSKNFMKLNGQMNTGYKDKNFKLTASKANSAYMALFMKELRMYFSYTVYFMNTAIFPILMIGGFAYACIGMKDEITLLMGYFPELVIFVLCGSIFTMNLMSCTTNSSISLEGENMNSLKAYPIDPMDIFNAKMSVNLMVTLPFGFVGGILAFIFLKISLIEMLLMMLTACTSGYFISAFGLILNLHFYRFDWENVATVVKQSMPVFITTMGGMVVGAAVIGLGFALQEMIQPIILVLLLNAILFIIDLLFYFYLKNGGKKQFYKIH